MQIYTTKNLRITNQPNQRGRWKQTYGNCTRQRFCVGYEYAPVSRVPLQFSFRLYIWTATMRLSTCRNQVLPELGTPLQHFEGRQRNTTVVSFCVHRCTHIHTCHTGMHWKARHFFFFLQVFLAFTILSPPSRGARHVWIDQDCPTFALKFLSLRHAANERSYKTRRSGFEELSGERAAR